MTRSRTLIPVSEMRRYYTRKSMAGEATPTRPAIESEASLAETERLADEAAVRWREALEKLAQ